MGTETTIPRAPTAVRTRSPLFAGLPVVVWILCAAFLATMLLWSFTRATFSAPDERAHVSAAVYLEEFRDWPGFKEMPVLLSVMRAADYIGTSPFEAGAAPPRPNRPSFADLTDETNLVSRTINQMTQHPPLYYAGLAGLHGAFGDELSFDQEVWLWRAISALLVAPLPLLAAALARRLGASRSMTVASAAMVAFLPGLAMLGGSVNNDNLLIAASGWAILGAGCVLTGDLRARTAIWIGAALAIALFTKAFAIPIAIGVLLAYVVAAVRARALARGALAALIMVAVASLGGWWWVRNLLVYGTIQPSGHTEPLADGPLSLGEALPQFVTVFFDRFFSRLVLGVDGSVAGFTAVVTSVIAVAVVAVAMIVWGVRSRPTGGQVAAGAALLAPFLLTGAIVVYQSVRTTQTTGITAGAQGRYLYPALIGVVAVFAVLASRALGERVRAVVLAVVAAAGIAITVWRVAFAVDRSWGPSSPTPWGHLDAVFAWSPLPYAASAAAYALFLAAMIAATVLVVREVALCWRSDAAGALSLTPAPR